VGAVFALVPRIDIKERIDVSQTVSTVAAEVAPSNNCTDDSEAAGPTSVLLGRLVAGAVALHVPRACARGVVPAEVLRPTTDY
jgi:hypothetical protein